MMATEESAVFVSRHGGDPYAAWTNVMHVTPPRARCSLNLNLSAVASTASSTWRKPFFVPAMRKSPVSSKRSARTSVSTLSFCSTWPFIALTRRSTALEFAATNTEGLKGRKGATGTGLESVKNLEHLPGVHGPEAHALVDGRRDEAVLEKIEEDRRDRARVPHQAGVDRDVGVLSALIVGAREARRQHLQLHLRPVTPVDNQ